MNEDKTNLIGAGDRCLGPKQARTTQCAAKASNGSWLGGVAFERNSRANPVKPHTRCYSIGNSFEGPTKIMAPCAGNKMTGARDLEAIEM